MTRSLTTVDFDLVREYLRRTAGLEFDEGRRVGLAAVLHDRLAATGLPSVPAYVDALERADSAAERQRLLDAVTIQETHFHRARPQIEALRQHLLPDVLRRAARDGREVVVWSAGCSTGEEPFTLAMLMLEVAASMPSPPQIRVLGTDVSTAALQVARAATYSGRTIDLAERSAVERWLRREADGTFVVREEVRDLVRFEHHNLVTDPPPFAPGSVDLVVCRHVTIYFSRETTRALVHRFGDVLGATGWLLMGPAESLWQVSDDFALHQVGEAFAYRAHPAPATAVPPPAHGHRGSRVAHARRVAPAGPAAAPADTGRARPRPEPPAHARPAAPGRRAPEPTATVPGDRPGPPVPGAPAVAAAQAAFDEGAYAESARLAEQALVDDPVSASAYLLLGHARLNQGDAASAVEPLQRAVFLDPLAGHAHFLLAVALSSSGRPKQAGPAYRAAANTLPGVPTDTVRRMLDGRRLQELVQLCHRLADESDGGVDPIRRGA